MSPFRPRLRRATYLARKTFARHLEVLLPVPCNDRSGRQVEVVETLAEGMNSRSRVELSSRGLTPEAIKSYGLSMLGEAPNERAVLHLLDLR